MLHQTLATPTVVANLVPVAAERLTLRPLRRSDAGLIAHYAGDDRVSRGTKSIPHPLPPGAADAMVARAADVARADDVWALDGSAHGLGELLGLITLHPMDRQQVEVSFWVAPALWGSGLASEALGALIAANPHGAKHWFAEVFQDSPGSAKVLTNNGFDYLGEAEAFCVARDAVIPTWTYARCLP